MELKEAIGIIKTKYPFKKSDEISESISQMFEIIKEKTHNFTHPEGISKTLLDMKSILQKLQIKPVEWRKSERGFQRSEADTVRWLAGYLTGKKSTVTASNEQQEDDFTEEEMELMKLKARAIKVKLKLLKYKLKLMNK